MNKSGSWLLDQRTACLQLNGLEAKVDLHYPSRGLYDLKVQGDSIHQMSLMGIAFEDSPSHQPEHPIDQYVRRSDLVVTYDQSSDRTARPQVYWRALNDHERSRAVGVELVISMQTNLLDSSPAVTISSSVPAAKMLRLNDAREALFEELDLSTGCHVTDARGPQSSLLLLRLHEGPWSYAQFAHPSDCVHVGWSVEESFPRVIRPVHQLFDGRLEKGVIRRGRVRGILVQREDDEQVAARCFEQFLSDALPLTT